MKRLLLVPAAGRGTRLGHDGPKFLFPLCGKPLIDHVLDIHRQFIDEAIVVVSSDARELAQEHFSRSELPVTIATQNNPTGMLDAILEGGKRIYEVQPDRVWITWCDQVAICAETLSRMAIIEEQGNDAMIVPAIYRRRPYIHFEMGENGRICRVLQRREGDEMPDIGNNDMGLFSLSLDAFQLMEREFSSIPELGEATGERNFLPFIPWLAERERVLSMKGTDEIETVGINTREEAAELESWLCKGKTL